MLPTLTPAQQDCLTAALALHVQAFNFVHRAMQNQSESTAAFLDTYGSLYKLAFLAICKLSERSAKQLTTAIQEACKAPIENFDDAVIALVEKIDHILGAENPVMAAEMVAEDARTRQRVDAITEQLNKHSGLIFPQSLTKFRSTLKAIRQQPGAGQAQMVQNILTEMESKIIPALQMGLRVM